MTDDRIHLALSEREAGLVKRALVVLAPFLEEAEEDQLRADMAELIEAELVERAKTRAGA